MMKRYKLTHAIAKDGTLTTRSKDVFEMLATMMQEGDDFKRRILQAIGEAILSGEPTEGLKNAYAYQDGHQGALQGIMHLFDEDEQEMKEEAIEEGCTSLVHTMVNQQASCVESYTPSFRFTTKSKGNIWCGDDEIIPS
jgi:hypothetical protein